MRVIAATLAIFISAPVSAATLNNISGVVYEGGVAPAKTAPPADIKIGDFNSNVSDPTLQIVGDTSIYGGVAHRTSTKYFDNWTMDFGTNTYAGVFNWQNTSANFDGRLIVGGVEYLLGSSGSISIGTVSGLVTFVLDPIYGNFGPNPDEVATWDLQMTSVPLPAGIWLLLSGIAGFGAIRRAQKT